MWQSGTIRIAKISGVAVDIHYTFALVILWGGYDGWLRYGGSQGAIYGIIAILLLFACVLLHELAHALQARALGLVVRRIILLPVGGLALLETPPSNPSHELLIALAGPAINLVVTAIAGILLLIISPSSLSNPLVAAQMLGAPGLEGALIYLFFVNLSLFVFNILPAFPMDGGRVMRAGLALMMPYVLATRIAAWTGRALAVLMALLGIASFIIPGPAQYMGQNLLLIVVGFIVYVGAHNEEVYVRRQWVLARVEVGQIYQKRIETVSPWDDLTAGLITRLFRYERILPVIVDERIVGLLGYAEAHRFVSKSPSVTVAHAMRTNFPTLHLRDTLWVALQAMTSDQLTMLPVVEENQFRGVVSLDDIDQAWRLVSSR